MENNGALNTTAHTNAYISIYCNEKYDGRFLHMHVCVLRRLRGKAFVPCMCLKLPQEKGANFLPWLKGELNCKFVIYQGSNKTQKMKQGIL